MKPRIAISAPMSVPMVHLCEVEDLLNEKFKIPYSHISFWDRKSQYDQKAFDSADAVIFLLKDFAFEGKEGSIPIGVDAELRQVHKQGKPAFLAYKLKTTGEIKFYTIRFALGPDYQKTWIKALSDTTGDFVNFINGFELIGIDVQSELEKSARKLAQNSTYGAFETEGPDYNEVLDRWKKAGFLENTDPIEQVKFPKMQRVYANTIPNPDYRDERLLLML
jgi:hypothetical protein